MEPLICPKCKVERLERISRPRFLKDYFPWLPLRRYFCYKCKRQSYVIISKERRERHKSRQ